MAADSRSTHTDALATLGTIIGAEEKRDAIHLGVEPAICGDSYLAPGEHVGFNAKGEAVGATPYNGIKAVGIVDPFLTEDVNRGMRFWLIVYPRQITSLRHVWEHPDFPASGETGGEQLLTRVQVATPTEEQLHRANLLLGEEKAVAKEAIRKIASDLRVSYIDLMDAAARYQEDAEYWSDGGRFEGNSIPPVFWDHYEKVTGENVGSNRYNFLSCSC